LIYSLLSFFCSEVIEGARRRLACPTGRQPYMSLPSFVKGDGSWLTESNDELDSTQAALHPLFFNLHTRRAVTEKIEDTYVKRLSDRHATAKMKVKKKENVKRE